MPRDLTASLAARLGRHAGAGPRSPVDRRRRQTLRAAGVGQRIQDTHCRPRSSPGRANRARWPPTKTARRNRAAVARGDVQIPRAANLRRHRPIQLVERHLGQNAVGQHAGGVNDAAQRRAHRRQVEPARRASESASATSPRSTTTLAPAARIALSDCFDFGRRRRAATAARSCPPPAPPAIRPRASPSAPRPPVIKIRAVAREPELATRLDFLALDPRPSTLDSQSTPPPCRCSSAATCSGTRRSCSPLRIA